MFRGDTVDVETIEKVKADLSGWKLTRSIFVGDAGMVSKDNLKKLSAGGGKYILCVPMGRGDEVTKLVLTQLGRYQRVAENLQIKEVTIGDGEARRRYVATRRDPVGSEIGAAARPLAQLARATQPETPCVAESPRLGR